jgi:nucleoside-diphosphate-sugar epimerase
MAERREIGRCLVTGANGFIGRALLDRLLGEGQRVRAALRAEGRLPARIDETVAVGALDGATDWCQALEGIGTVIHVAGRAHVFRPDDRAGVSAFMTINCEGTVNLARQAAAAGVGRFVFVSSIGVNGRRSGDRPFRISDPPAPVGPYASSKWRAEQGLRELVSGTKMEVVIVRPPLVYGRGARGTFPLLVGAIRRRWPLPIGGIRNRRSFIGIDNLTDLLWRCASVPEAAGQTFLAADGEDVSTPELGRRIAAALGVRPSFITVPPAMLRLATGLLGKAHVAEGLWESMYVDIEATRQVLSWTPPLSLDQGILRALSS